jgi:hypothetical protein
MFAQAVGGGTINLYSSPGDSNALDLRKQPAGAATDLLLELQAAKTSALIVVHEDLAQRARS